MFYVSSTARSFRDGTPIYCPMWRTCSSVNKPFPPGIEPQVIRWQSITLALRHASSHSLSLWFGIGWIGSNYVPFYRLCSHILIKYLKYFYEWSTYLMRSTGIKEDEVKSIMVGYFSDFFHLFYMLDKPLHIDVHLPLEIFKHNHRRTTHSFGLRNNSKTIHTSNLLVILPCKYQNLHLEFPHAKKK